MYVKAGEPTNVGCGRNPANRENLRCLFNFKKKRKGGEEMKFVEEEKYKVSGTASESDLKLDDKPVEEEVLDEHAIKREVQMSDAEFRGKMIYMAVFLGVIILALLFMPLIFKLLHL